MDYIKYYKKSKIERDDQIDIKESQTIDKTIHIILLIALILIPIFIKAHVSQYISPSLTLISTGVKADIFSYYKYVFLIITTIIVGCLFIYKVLFLQHNIEKSKLNLFLAILTIIVISSAILSPYKSLALHGMYNRHEGTITFICYLSLFFVAANTKFSDKQLRGFLYSLYPFVIINLILGLAVFYEKNLLGIDWIQNFIVGSIPEGTQINEGATLWATVSNPNYISGLSAVLCILFLSWAMFDHNRIRMFINLIIALFSFVTVLTSLSTSGFLTLLTIFLVLIIFVFTSLRKKKPLLVLITFLILATSIFFPLANKNSRVWDETFGSFITTNPFEEKQISIRSLSKDLTIGDINLFKASEVFAEEGTDVKFSIPTLPESGIGAGTGRLYEWVKTFETAIKRPLLGYGLDTFVYVFPQNDIEKKANLRKYDVIVDKPHNMYLGLFIGTGIFGLLSFLLLVGTIVVQGVIQLLRKVQIREKQNILLAIFLAILAYLFQAIFNDSVVGSGIIFWVYLGVLTSLIKEDVKS